MWHYKTKRGTVSIKQHKNGRYEVIYDQESLGSYKTPQQAADDVAGGHTFMPSNGVDLGELDIPADLPEWYQGNQE